MDKSKYGQYITPMVMKMDMPEDHFHKGKISNAIEFDRRFFPEADHHIESFIIYKPGAGFGYEGSSLNIINGKQFKDLPLKLPVVEMTVMVGTDPENPTELGGEVEFWFGEGEGAEKHTITKSSCVYCPPGLVHMPIIFRRVDRPFLFIVIVSAPELNAESLDDAIPEGFSEQL